MKLILSNAWVAFLTFFSPLFPLMLIITIAAIFDTFVGRWYARNTGKTITSGETRRGLTSKLILYLSVILFAFLIDKYMVNDIARNYIWFDYGFTRFWTAFFVWIEYSSIDEKIKWLKGEGITDKIVRFFKGFKRVIKEGSDIKDKISK